MWQRVGGGGGSEGRKKVCALVVLKVQDFISLRDSAIPFLSGKLPKGERKEGREGKYVVTRGPNGVSNWSKRGGQLGVRKRKGLNHGRRVRRTLS